MTAARTHERILVDSVDFGIQESERQHLGEGCLAQKHPSIRSHYGGMSFLSPDDGIFHHWRDLAGLAAVSLRAFPEWADRPLAIEITLAAYAVGEPADPPASTTIAVEVAGREVRRESLVFPVDGRWRLVQLPLGRAAEGRSAAVRVVLDDRANLLPGGAHYGKSLAAVRLVALSEEDPDAREWIVVDAVDLGVAESERWHRPSGALASPNPNPVNTYRGASRILNARDLTHYREAPHINGVHLRVPPGLVGAPMELEFAIRTYASAGVSIQPVPTVLAAMGRTRYERLASVVVPLDGRFHVHRVPLPPEAAEESGFSAVVDDGDNVDADAVLYGKAIGYVRLLAAPDARPVARIGQVRAAERPEIVLVMCPVWNTHMPPVALGALASALEGAGVSVAVHDFNIDCYHAADAEGRKMWEGHNAVLWSEWEYGQAMVARHEGLIQQAADRVLAMEPRFVGFSVATVNAPFSRRLAQILKERRPETTIIFGGPGVPFFEPGGLGPHWDYLVYGAGERPLLSILKNGNARALGVVRRGEPDRYEPRRNRAYLTDLDALPLLHYGHFDLSKYLHPWRLPVMTSRGCINSCRYCFDQVFYGPYACLSGERAFAQIEHLVRRHGQRFLEFSDLLCNGDLAALRTMCELLVRADLGVEWGSFAVVRPGMTPELMRLVRASGCRYLHYGFESGSAHMLRLMGRNYSVQDAVDTLRNTKEAGIRTVINIMVGFPGETDRTVDETVEFIGKYARYIDVVDTVNPVYIMAATDLVENRDRYGIEMPDGIPDHWATPEMNEAKRREWVYRVIDAVRAAGVRCNSSVMRGFTCRNTDTPEVG